MSKNSVRNIINHWMPQSWAARIALLIIIIGAFFLGSMLSDGVAPDGHEHATAESESTTWTCSMHPQIKLPKSGKCPICFMDLIPLESGSADDLGPRQIRMTESAKKLAKIATTPAIRAFGEAEITIVGKISYDETNQATITARMPGRLERLYADYTGIKVNRGDHMVEIYSPELLTAQEELIQARKTLASTDKSSNSILQQSAQQTLEAARGKLKLWGLTDEQINEIEKSDEHSHTLTLTAPVGGVVVEMNAAEGEYVKTGTRIYTIADLSKLWVLLEAYESDLPWLRYGQKLTFTSLSFPGEEFDALISFINPIVDPATRTIKIRAIVDNSDNRLKPDMFVSAVVKSKIDNKGNVISEYLAGKWIGPMHPEVVKDRPGICDVCGMDLVPTESLGYSGKKASISEAPILIPASAPLITGKRAVVYVEMPGGDGPLFEGREIELGPRAGDFYIVKSGIEEGEAVVTNGAFRIDSELQIQARTSMMSPESAIQAQLTIDEIVNSPVKYIHEENPALETLAPVYNAYFEIQMALANDNPELAATGFGKLGDMTRQANMSVFSHDGHERWMELSANMLKASERGKTAENLEDARDAFYHLSITVIDLHKTFGHLENRDYYLTYCPMARDNKGAYWLQTEDIVWNSFYGDLMLRCGEIKKPLKPESSTER
ncbi:MAG: efflux RND transporter periplasmic adaptor subunit [candidate division Zixibacteria bacterium]